LVNGRFSAKQDVRLHLGITGTGKIASMTFRGRTGIATNRIRFQASGLKIHVGIAYDARTTHPIG
jgi:hypothetical protein